MAINVSHKRRLYDCEPQCTEIIFRLEQLSPEIQKVFGQLILGLGNRIRSQQKLHGQVPELGAEALKGLMHHHYKERWYDRDPVLSQAFKHFYLLGRAGRSALTFKIHEAVSLVSIYSESCHHAKLPQRTEDVRAIIMTSITEGKEKGRELLESIANTNFFGE